MEKLPALFELSQAFHACTDASSLARVFASQLARGVDCGAVLVWLVVGKEEELVCSGRWFEPGARFEPQPGPATEGILAEIREEGAAGRARRVSGDEIEADALAHFAETERERVESALYVPLAGSKGVCGVVELLNHHGGEFSAEDAAFAEEACRIGGRALDTVLSLDSERQESLGTIERLTALYDISRIFNSTLELEDLLPIVADRIANILGVEVCNVWLVDSDEGDLYFAQQVGEDPTTDEDARLPLGEGVLGKVAQSGEAILIENATEEALLAERRKAAAAKGGPEIQTLMCAPLLKDEAVVGVVEVVNKSDGSAFNRDDLFFLRSISQQAAIALHNANLLEAERKVHELDALLTISKEITSTLNLDHVLTTVVHQAATVVPFDRCAIGLFDRNRFILGAVSGEKEVPKTPEMEQLREVLEWVARQPEPVSADEYEEGWQVKPEQARQELLPYLQANELCGFYAIPLRDDQGVVGVLALVSSEAEFLSERHVEMLAILASQTTVAIRNARLYHEVPLMSVWKPLVQRRKKLQAMAAGRWLELGWKVGLVALLLVAVPWKLRIGANASVVPADRRVVSAEVGGVIQEVAVREGDAVEAGRVLGVQDDSDASIKRAAARASLELARRQMVEAESRGDLGSASQARLRVDLHQSEADLYEQKIAKARLRAPIRGVVVTPKIEERVGRYLEPGEPFTELVDLDRMAVEMNVPETQISHIRPGSLVSLKLNALPTDTLTGSVVRVGASTITAENEQFFVVRAEFSNPGRKARAGMVGRAKITASGGWAESGWYPIGYVMFRAPARWVYQKAWTWLP
jgi:RND family efflux transporter MFP subunit